MAGVIFTRKDRTDINNLEDARGKVASAGLENMFLAYQLGFATIAGKGHDPERFFSKIYHHDLPVLETVKQVRSGEADVGVLRACILESEFLIGRTISKSSTNRKILNSSVPTAPIFIQIGQWPPLRVSTGSNQTIDPNAS